MVHLSDYSTQALKSFGFKTVFHSENEQSFVYDAQQSFSNEHNKLNCAKLNSWVSYDVIDFNGGQLQIETQSELNVLALHVFGSKSVQLHIICLLQNNASINYNLGGAHPDSLLNRVVNLKS